MGAKRQTAGQPQNRLQKYYTRDLAFVHLCYKQFKFYRMSLESYFMTKIKPLQAVAEDERDELRVEQVVTHPDLTFLDSLEAWSDFVVVLETGTRLKCHKVRISSAPVIKSLDM